MTENHFHFTEFVKERKANSVSDFSEYIFMDNVPMSANGYIASAVILFLIGVIGFTFNFIVLFIMIKEKSLHTPFNMILLNLTFSDLCVSILGNPVSFTSAVQQKWIFGRTICILYGFFMGLIGITSIATITVLSYERYLNIARPFHSRGFTMSRSILVICGIWIYSFMLTFPPLVGWGEYVNESANISCSVNWEQRNLNATTYIIYLFVFGLVLPICVICFCYTKMLMVLTQKRFRSGRVRRVEVKVAAMIAVMVIVFLFVWTPYAVLALIVAFGNPDIVTPAASVIPALIAKSSICYNPIIYAALNNQIRAAGYKVFGIRSIRELSREEGKTGETEEIVTEARFKDLEMKNEKNISFEDTAA